MHARDDNDRVTVETIEKGVREALWDEGATGVAMQDGVGFRVFEQSIPSRPESREKLVA
jgi:hypothetical protein